MLPVPEIIVFGVLALTAAGSAVAMLLSRNAVYSALFLVLNFASVALLYLVLGAPFIAMTQITVYAGAIIVLFLFVIMLLGAERLPGVDKLRGSHVALAITLAGVFFAEAFMVFAWRGGSLTPGQALPEGFGNPEAIGIALFTRYALPFEVTSVILLVGVIGAIVLIQRKDIVRGKGKRSFMNINTMPPEEEEE